MNKVLTNMNQDLSAMEKQTARENIGAEDASNKVTSISSSSTDAQYPSAKCVFDELQNVGGGYKDGGELVDGDFIKAENNAISSYDNVSRDPVNFYFDIAEGEVINSVIQFTTQVNATVNVYVVRNGLYFLLGNTNGNTVLANEDYEITCTGNSFEIEQVNDLNAEPVMADFDGRKIWVFPFGDYLISEDLGDWYSLSEYESLIAGSEWSKPTSNIINSLISNFGYSAIRSTSGWSDTQGTNTTGLNFYPYGVNSYGSYYDVGQQSEFWVSSSSGNYLSIWENSSSVSTYGNDPQIKLRARIVKKYKNL